MFENLVFEWPLDKDLSITESIDSLTADLREDDDDVTEIYSVHGLILDYRYLTLLKEIYERKAENDEKTNRQNLISNLNSWYKCVDYFFQQVAAAFGEFAECNEDSNDVSYENAYENARKKLLPVLLKKDGNGNDQLQRCYLRKVKVTKENLNRKVLKLKTKIYETFSAQG